MHPTSSLWEARLEEQASAGLEGSPDRSHWLKLQQDHEPATAPSGSLECQLRQIQPADHQPANHQIYGPSTSVLESSAAS